MLEIEHVLMPIMATHIISLPMIAIGLFPLSLFSLMTLLFTLCLIPPTGELEITQEGIWIHTIFKRKRILYRWENMEKIGVICGKGNCHICAWTKNGKQTVKLLTMHSYKGIDNTQLADELNKYLQKISS